MLRNISQALKWSGFKIDHFFNTNTLEHKWPVVQTMLHWAKTQSSYTANKNEEESRNTEKLRRNGYASGFNKQCVRKTSKTETLSTS